MTNEPEDARKALDMIREIGGDELVLKLLASFITYADKQMLSALEAAPLGNTVEVARVAHALKSSARQLGAHGFGEACARAEEHGKGADGPRTAVEDVRLMQESYAPARHWMEAMVGGA